MIKRVLLCKLSSADLAGDSFAEFLLDAADSTIILIGKWDPLRVPKSSFTPAAWGRFTKAFARLRRRNRVVTCDDVDPECTVLNHCSCPSERANADFVLDSANIAGYANDPIRPALRKYDYCFDAPVPVTTFTAGMLRAFATFARTVTLVDKNLGVHWLANNRYRETLDYLIPFLQASGVGTIRIVTSVTGDGEIDLHAYCSSRGIELSNVQARDLPHNRAIVSDRFVIKIDCGFDLIRAHAMIRGTDIFVQQEYDDYLGGIGRAGNAHPNFSCFHCHEVLVV